MRGDCDICGEWSSHLVHGECAACRERMRPDPWEESFDEVPPEIPSCTCNFAALILMLLVCGALLIWWIK